jgi:hypothetical protein
MTDTKALIERDKALIRTNEVRWFLFRMPNVLHPHAIQYGPDCNLFMVLQQRWTATIDGESDEWRDVPMVQECPPRAR